MLSAWAEVDLDAVAANVTGIRAAVGLGCRVLVVVKADAYGHGAVEIARAALEAGADALAVALVEEALELRRAGIRAPIHLLGAVPPAQLPLVVEADLVAGIGDEATARLLGGLAAARGRQVRVHVEVDTGLTRFGAACEAASALVRAVSALPGLVLEGIYTHFANAEDPDDPFTEEQLARFLDVLRPLEADPGLRLTRHAAGSSAVLHWPASRLDAVRPGLLVLGVYPTTKLRRTIAVTPVMRVWARVARCRVVPAGTSVGYGRTYLTRGERTIATVLLGFGSGYPRQLANRGVARVRDRLCPVVGAVGLSHLMLDVSGVGEIAPGEPVELVGAAREAANSVEALAAAAQLPVDAICMVGRQLARVYLRRGQPARLVPGPGAGHQDQPGSPWSAAAEGAAAGGSPGAAVAGLGPGVRGAR